VRICRAGDVVTRAEHIQLCQFQLSILERNMKTLFLHLATTALILVATSQSLLATGLSANGNPTDSTAVIVQRGQMLYANGQYFKVIEILHARGIDTTNALASSLVGMSYAALNDFENAILFLKRACAADSSNIAFRFQLAAFSSLSGLMAQAETEYKTALALDSTFLPALSRLGMIYYDQKLYEQSALYFSSVLRGNPRDYLANYYLGSIMVTMNEEDSAISFLESCIRLNSGFVPAFDVLASLYYAQKDYAHALDLYQKAVQIRPASADFKYKVGLCYRQLKEYDRAISYFKDAAAIDSTNAAYFAQLGYCYFNINRCDSSIIYSLKAISYDDQNFTYYTNLALAYQKLDSVKDLISVYRKMIELHDPDSVASLYYQIAWRYSPQKETAKAVEAYKRAIAIRPYYPAALYSLAVCYDIAGNMPAANKAYEEYLQRTASDSTENGRRYSVKMRLTNLKQ